MKTKEEVFSGFKLAGIPALLLNFIFLVGIVLLFIYSVSSLSQSIIGVILIITCILLFICNMVAWGGFMQIEPNEARVMIFFGKYNGTVKENGFFWVNPFYAKKKLTLRARNLDAEPIKVNDKAGNPVMIGMVVVWRVVDTYKASFDVDNASMTSGAPGTATDNVNAKMKAYENFVKIQSDAALRKVAGMYAYDHNTAGDDSSLTLRAGGEEMNEILENQINERLRIAGIEVIEARINYIAYAPEIAAVMLRRQQADAIIAAREKIVEGAVGMVKMALDKLSKDGIIELDDEKKAAMVSNLLVVLCGESNAQPVINSGTLYNG
ncbi:MAG TPA: SPFH domain-containing protein [Paludibacteraceae bacterium]|nr:SPFH domain-containing protein [Paludibacteraceae bacterium]HPT43856.1 SPFH domain-containing protein [Paludibacteraceae bacterium]